MTLQFIILPAILAVASAGYLAPLPSHYGATPAVGAKVASPSIEAVALTHQNVVRSFDGTVSQYSKSVDTPYSSVHKEDTRVSNNVYTPAEAKAVSYAAPVLSKTTYGHPEPTDAIYATSAPHKVHPHEQSVHTPYSSVHKEDTRINNNAVSYTAPVLSKTIYGHPEPTHAVYATSAPHKVHPHEQPAHNVYASPTTPTADVLTHQYAVPSTATTTTTTYNHSPAATNYTHNSPGVSAHGSRQTVQYSPANMVSHMSFDGFGTHWAY